MAEHTGEPTVVGWDEVRKQELDSIVERRRQVGLLPASGDAVKQREQVAEDLVGLALSGGGIRSASFNLGFLQALHRAGLFRYVDYLSTVSGGGYIGSLFSSLLLRPGVKLDADFPLAAAANGQQPARVFRVLRGGDYLNRPIVFACRYLLGVLFNNLVLLSGLVAVCAFIAWLWRLLDTSPLADHLMWMSGFLILDVTRPFLPAILLLIMTLVIWVLGYVRRGSHNPGRVSQCALRATGMTVAIGTAVWLSNPSINFTPPAQWIKLEGSRLTFQKMFYAPLLGLIALCLLPFLSPRRLLRSGTQPEAGWERVVFRISSTALLAGIPLALIGLFARHDLTGYNRHRGPDLLHTDIRHWEGFWNRVRADNGCGPGQFIWSRLPEDLQKGIEENPDRARELSALPVPVNPEYAAWKKTVVKHLNETVIAAEDFYRTVEAFQDPLFKERIAELPAERRKEVELLLLRARQGGFFRPSDPSDPLEKRFDELKQLNRLLLETYYPEAVWDRAVVRRSVVVARDQWHRLLWVVGAAALCVVFALLVDVNATSLHWFYRNQLAGVYVEPPSKELDSPRLCDLTTTAKGGPYHLLTGTRNVLGGLHKSDARTSSFLFSQKFCGSASLDFAPTKQYLQGELDLAGAMALSGAAFSPAQVHNRLVAFFMLILNLRLGQWLPSPSWSNRGRRFTFAQLLADLCRRPKDRHWWFITDGGHNENLGLGALLRRECSLIIVADAGQDRDHGFDDFVKLLWRARLRGLRFVNCDDDEALRMEDLVPDRGTGLCKRQSLLARIRYPSGKSGLLVYVKPSLTGDEEIDLKRYRTLHPDFPHDPTVEQIYGENSVEAYRALGFAIGRKLCVGLPVAADPPLDVEDLVARWLLKKGRPRVAAPAEMDNGRQPAIAEAPR